MSRRDDQEKRDSQSVTRRQFLGAAATAMVASGLSKTSWLTGAEPAAAKVVVGGHPWVYAAKLPNYDITPILPQIFADMKYAGIEAIELIHTALRPKDAVERIGELSKTIGLPVLGASFGGAMWTAPSTRPFWRMPSCDNPGGEARRPDTRHLRRPGPNARPPNNWTLRQSCSEKSSASARPTASC